MTSDQQPPPPTTRTSTTSSQRPHGPDAAHPHRPRTPPRAAGVSAPSRHGSQAAARSRLRPPLRDLRFRCAPVPPGGYAAIGHRHSRRRCAPQTIPRPMRQRCDRRLHRSPTPPRGRRHSSRSRPLRLNVPPWKAQVDRSPRDSRSAAKASKSKHPPTSNGTATDRVAHTTSRTYGYRHDPVSPRHRASPTASGHPGARYPERRSSCGQHGDPTPLPAIRERPGQPLLDP